jgi:hypothetical protein
MSTETVETGRTADGKFSVGNKAAANHRRRQHIATLRNAFSMCLTVDDIENVVATLLKLAQEGDTAAIKLILERALGKPESFADLPEPESEPLCDLGGPITAENFVEKREELRLRIAKLKT